MTRETKIGLLVGLAFIIVIGVLLSDHIQSATQPQRAALVIAPDSLHKGIVSPGGQYPGVNPIVPPARVEPPSQVATNDSISQTEHQAVVSVGPGTAEGVPLQPEDGVSDNARLAGGQVNDGGAIRIGPPTGATTLAAVPPVKILVTRDPNQTFVSTNATPVAPRDSGNASAPVAGKAYVAAEGDSLYRITAKVYGKYTKAGSDLILKANPAMGPKGEKISIGKSYVIPALPGTTGANAQLVVTNTPTPVAPVAPTPAPVQPVKQTPVSTVMFKTYVVKDGDSLWKIANKQLAGGHTIGELKNLNKDVLKGTDIVRPGMTLKIPTGQVASAE